MFLFEDVPDLFGVRWLQTKLIDRLFKKLEGVLMEEKVKSPSLWKSDMVIYCDSQEDHERELREWVGRVFGDKDVEVDWEYSGAGKYRFQVWSDRPEGLPLVALKWEGV